MPVETGGAGSVIFTSTNTVARLRSWSLDTSNDLVDTTSMDSTGHKEFAPGLRGATGSIVFLYDSTEETGQDAILDKVFAAAAFGDTLGAIELRHATGSGKARYTGNALFSGLSMSGAAHTNDPVEFTANFTLTGAPTRAAQA